jgi:flagellar motor component MotA
LGVLIGLIIGIGSLLGGFIAMGGHVAVIWQPWEYVIISFAPASRHRAIREAWRKLPGIVRGLAQHLGKRIEL